MPVKVDIKPGLNASDQERYLAICETDSTRFNPQNVDIPKFVASGGDKKDLGKAIAKHLAVKGQQNHTILVGVFPPSNRSEQTHVLKKFYRLKGHQ